MDSVKADSILKAVLSIFLAYCMQQNFLKNILVKQFLVEEKYHELEHP